MRLGNTFGNKLGLETLKPCPFCGGPASLVNLFCLEGYIRVECQRCHASTETLISGDFDEMLEKAVKLWNARIEVGNEQYYGKINIESQVMFSNFDQLYKFLESFTARLSCSPDIWVNEGKIKRAHREREIAVKRFKGDKVIDAYGYSPDNSCRWDFRCRFSKDGTKNIVRVREISEKLKRDMEELLGVGVEELLGEGGR